MEQHTHIPTTPHIAMTNFVSFIFFALAWFSYSLHNITGTDIYNFCFRALSIISVSLVIIINWPKAKPIIIRNFKKLKSWKRKKKGN